jgi:purine-nucleoside phosphorylase
VSRLDDFGPRIGVVLGSGLGAVADLVQDADVVPYDELAGFPPAGVAGHAGRALLGTIAGARVAVLQGRAHVYEGHAPEVVAGPMRALASAGAELVLLTNAAGSLRPEVGPGSLMAITDHINLMGFNPLVGPHFVPMGAAYDPALRALLDVEHEGVYLAVRGPSFETPAEIRAFRTLGADAVGMSTVPEAIAARHMGLEVLGISCITNMAAGVLPQPLVHDEVMETARRVRGSFISLLEGIIERV